MIIVCRLFLGVGLGGIFPLSATKAGEDTSSSSATDENDKVTWPYLIKFIINIEYSVITFTLSSRTHFDNTLTWYFQVNPIGSSWAFFWQMPGFVVCNTYISVCIHTYIHTYIHTCVYGSRRGSSDTCSPTITRWRCPSSGGSCWAWAPYPYSYPPRCSGSRNTCSASKVGIAYGTLMMYVCMYGTWERTAN